MEQPPESQTPRNRHERRAAKSAARRARAARARPAHANSGPDRQAATGAPVPEPPPSEPRHAEAAAAAEGDESPRGLEHYYLEIFGRTRGPLFENPRSVICRVIALSVVTRLCRAGGERALRVRAARVFDEALAEVPDSNSPATGEDWARACAAFADISRAVRGYREGQDLPGALVEIFARHCGKRGELEHMRHYAWAELLAAVLLSGDDALCLRAARTLLARTRDEARKVGPPIEDDPEAREVLDAIRAERGVQDDPEDAPAPGGNGVPWEGGYECSGAGPP